MIFRDEKQTCDATATGVTKSKDTTVKTNRPSGNKLIVKGKDRSEKITITAPAAAVSTPASSSTSSSSFQVVAAPSPKAADIGLPPDVEKRKSQLYKKTKLVPLDLLFSQVREKDEIIDLNTAHNIALKTQVINARKNAHASVLFVVKRPGCILCHEQGHDLEQLIKEFPAESVGAFACVKEIDVDNEGLLGLYQSYFRFPFFRDTNWNIYKVLGDRRVNILTALWRYKSAKARWESKGLNGNMIGKGEGMLLGGVMIFDRKGELQYAYKEKFGLALPVDEIRTAINNIIN